MKRPWYFLASLALLLTLAVNACATSPAPTAPTATTKPAEKPTTAPTGATGATKPAAAPTGTLRVAIADFSYESMDPIYYTSFWGNSMYDPLLTYDPKGSLIGGIAEKWTLSPDGNTWTFTIRKGVKFHNGDPLTSADVSFSVVRFASQESTNPWSPYLRNNFDSVATPDDYTFVYKTQKPDPQLGQTFAATRILPKNYIEKVGIDEFRLKPIGSGPWKFVKFVSRTSMEMEANKDHWRIVPAFERVIETMVPEEATRIAMLKRGEVDIIGSLSIDRIVELKNQGFRLQEVGLPTVGNFSFSGTWMTDGPTSDIRVRQAMSYSINRDELSKTFFKGLAVPGSRWFMDENSWGWDPSWKPDPYDVTKAKALLAEAGYPGKFKNPTITVYVTAAGYTADLFQVLQGYWKEVGIETKIEVVDSVQFGGMIFNRAKNPTDPIVGAIWPWVFPGVPNNVYHSANMYKSTGVHTTGNDPKADELYDKAATELDMAKAEKYWTEFQNYAKEMWVNVGLVKLPSNWVVGPAVGEFTSNAHIGLNDAYAGIQHKK